jgi:hypothetical protein
MLVLKIVLSVVGAGSWVLYIGFRIIYYANKSGVEEM